jgi:hypothetical protein
MSEEYPDRPVKITSTPRKHPAIRAIARACIALARWQQELEAHSPGAAAEQARPPRPRIDAPSGEVRHD